MDLCVESWRKTWRDGIAPLLSDNALAALRDALFSDDPRLIQGATTSPPPLKCVEDWPVECGCAFAYAGACELGGFLHDAADMADRLRPNADACTVAEAEEFFAQLCHECDLRLGEPAACRWFLNWFDETPRDEMRGLLLAEVNRTLAQRVPVEAAKEVA